MGTSRGGVTLGGQQRQKWLRLFEQLSPIFKWTAGGLPTVQSCPRRRAPLATNARRGGQLGAHQGDYWKTTDIGAGLQQLVDQLHDLRLRLAYQGDRSGLVHGCCRRLGESLSQV
jgi:hypothetical protein